VPPSDLPEESLTGEVGQLEEALTGEAGQLEESVTQEVGQPEESLTGEAGQPKARSISSQPVEPVLLPGGRGWGFGIHGSHRREAVTQQQQHCHGEGSGTASDFSPPFQVCPVYFTPNIRQEDKTQSSGKGPRSHISSS